jgi:hypothetical protein
VATAEPSVATTAAASNLDCEGVAAWARSTDDRLDALQALADEADRLASVFDLAGYVMAIDAYASAVDAAAAQQMSPPVPVMAEEANARALAAYSTMREAASLFLHYYTVEMSPDVFGQAASTYADAVDLAARLRSDTGRLRATCEGL